MRGQRSRRTHQAVAVFLSSLVATGSVPWTAFAAPPKPAAAAPAKPAAGKKGNAKPGKGDNDPKRAEARKNYAEGEAKFQAGDYEAAYGLYKAANDAVPAPQTLYKMALSLDKLDKTSEAIAAYGAFLGSNPPSSMDAKVTEAQARVAELRRKAPIVVKVKSDPPGASVSVDGVAQMGTAPLDVKVPPGSHKFRVSAPGYDPYEKDFTFDPGASETTLDAVLTKSVAVAEAPPPVVETKSSEKTAEQPSERHSNVAAFVVLGVAGAGAIVGGIFGVKALQGKSDFNGGERTTDKADQVEKNALIADMALGAAITLGVTGTVLLLTSGGSDEKTARSAQRTQFQIAPVLSPHRAGAAATLRF
jgi:PEGA domain